MNVRRFLLGTLLLSILFALLMAAHRFVRSQPLLPTDITKTADILYGDPTVTAERLDIYQPKQTTGNLPLVVWIHGGGWEAGNKSDCPGMLFAEHGFVVASVEYRFSKAAVFPAQIYDCKAAVRYLRAHAADYHIDPTRIGVWGGSAGGHLVALLGTSIGNTALEGTVGDNVKTSSAVEAVCDWYGPSDFISFVDQIPTDKIDFYNNHSSVTHLFGGDVSLHKDLAKEASPVTYVTRTAPPFLIMHGTADNVVPIAQSQELYDDLIHAGATATFIPLPGAGHGFGDPASIVKAYAFFAKTFNVPAAS